jgi:hypothetical protein
MNIFIQFQAETITNLVERESTNRKLCKVHRHEIFS